MTRHAKRPATTSAPTGRSLAQLIAGPPRIGSPPAARAKVAAWLDDIGRTADGKALGTLLAANPALETLMAGIAEGSPYLWQLATSAPARLLALLRCDPEPHFSALLAHASAAVAGAGDEALAMRRL